jgi:hypothetical protein
MSLSPQSYDLGLKAKKGLVEKTKGLAHIFLRAATPAMLTRERIRLSVSSVL